MQFVFPSYRFLLFPRGRLTHFLLGGHTDKMQTKGLTLEEVNRAFGDKVEMEMSDITDVQAEKQAVTFKNEE
jgi:hypothetical protein